MSGSPTNRKGRERVFDNPRSGRSVTSVSDENIIKLRKLITKDRPITVRIIADKLQINRESRRTNHYPEHRDEKNMLSSCATSLEWTIKSSQV
ncbi:hypothetical protein TNCV_3519571 [Trichonephila clavipes]|uniref:Uncharacterized protein n=1 Tax=Trichonephila clavipes TaxID=2585209 RepID=A0A8X6VGC9_TRICX|nr:hypothetical protein TNCV_3519571 [Trichonephila clavipes]